jgi:hypothetical protein
MKRLRGVSGEIITRGILRTQTRMASEVEKRALEARAMKAESRERRRRGGEGKRRIAGSKGEGRIARIELLQMQQHLLRCSSSHTERQEKDILADLTFSEHETGISLVTRPQEEDDFETEELHFEYNPLTERPRVFNDMITLRSGDHMIKLAMSHAIAQSTKLSFFEERMNQTMLDAQHVPKHLALTGELGMSRTQIVQILGRLFKSRVDVNLCKLSWPTCHANH